MDYTKISKDTIGLLYAGYKSFDASPLAADLKALIELRVSQINGCAYCCNLHRNEAVKLGVNQDKIESLSEFTASSLFSDAEKEARASNKRITLVDAKKLYELWISYYDKLSQADRALFPLKPIYYLNPEE